MLVRGRVISLAFMALAAIVSGGSCTGGADDQTPIPADPGSMQTPGGGATVSESAACMRLRSAEERARQHLNCPELNRKACPFYVRPAGTGCWTYSESSLAACEAAIASYEFCADFTQHPCVLTATPTDPASCPALGAGGEGGQAGANGQSGQTNGGQSGQSGSAGETSAGASGQPGAGGSSGSDQQGGAPGASGESGHAGAGG
jgi:hypothetical protein